MPSIVGKLSYDPHSDLIGRGKFGTVYRGYLTNTCSGKEMFVAIKRIQKVDVTVKSFQNEVEAMRKASSHPYILDYICTEKDDYFLYIATILCNGTLNDYIKGKYDGPKFNSEKEILLQLTLGLAHLHSNNIAHRDIQPTNCLIYISEGTPQMKVADFGLSKLMRVDQEDYTNSNLSNPSGTRGWIAPEAYDQKRCGLKVDIWSLGLIFGYTLSGGKHPFGEDLDERSNRIKKKEPMVLVQQDLKEPYSFHPEAFKLILSMLNEDPNQRPDIAVIKSSPFLRMDPSSACQLIKQRPQPMIIDPSHYSYKEGFRDLITLLLVGHKMFERKRPPSRMASYRRTYILRRKTYLNVHLGTVVLLYKNRNGPSVEKRANKYQSVHMKKKKKPMVKTLKVMDVKKLHPNLRQPEFKLTQPKMDVVAIKRPLASGIGKIKAATARLRRHHLYKKSLYDKDARLSNGILSGLSRSFELSSSEELLIERYANNLSSSSSSMGIKIECESDNQMWEVTYDVAGMLGKGAYGKVFRGKLINRKTGTETEVAVKRHEILRVDMFRTLVEMGLDHPNVVKFIHYEDVGDIFRLCCLELGDASLDKAFLPDDDSRKYRGQLPDEIDFMLQLSHGLDYIHSKNLVHRDVKPDNILIHSSSSNGQVLIKLSDFLSSKETKDGEFEISSRDYKGTMYYWPSEIFSFVDEISRLPKETNNEKILIRTKLTNKIDTFTCGIAFFKFLTRGKHPFGTEDKEIIENLRQSEPKNLHKILPPSYFAFNIIKRMLEKKEEERPNSKEIVLMLSSIQEDGHFIQQDGTNDQQMEQGAAETNQFSKMKPNSKNKLAFELIQHTVEIEPEKRPSAKTVSRNLFFNKNQQQEHFPGIFMDGHYIQQDGTNNQQMEQDGTNDKQMEQNTTETNQFFEVKPNSKNKLAAFELIQHTVEIEPEKRPSAETATRNPFFNKNQQQKHLPETKVRSTGARSKEKSTKKIEIDETSEQAQVLGKGYNGTIVFKGRYDGRDVAVKRIQMQNAQIQASREKDALLWCQHPNILQLFKVENNNDFMWLTLELCAGNLSDFCLGHYIGPFPTDIEAMKQMLEGLSYVHQQRCIHRGINPNNILISIDGILKIAGFGFCKPIESDDTDFFSIPVIGTEGWIAPELLRCDSVLKEIGFRTKGSTIALFAASSTTDEMTTATDVFPLGCVFYYLLTRGFHPFGSGTQRDINILEGKHKMSKLGKGCIFRGLIRKMIHHSPKHRPQIQEILTRSVFKVTSPNNSIFEKFVESVRIRFTPKTRRKLKSSKR